MKSNVMTYRGYSATVEYSDADGCFFGRVLGIRDIVSFEGASVAALRKDFKNAVDDYLKACEEIGKPPERPCSGKLSLRLPVELHRELTTQSEITGESVNNLIVEAVAASYPNGKQERRPGVRKARKDRPKAGAASRWK